MFYQFADLIVFNLLNLAPDSFWGQALHFFIYDSFKILFILFLVTQFMTIFRSYLPLAKLREFLTKHKFYGFDYLLASMLGAITPFCTCSSTALFIGFLQAGLPLGIVFAFMITSPLINEVALALFIGIFGWKITLLYAGSGILIGVVGGFILGKMKLEKYIKKELWEDLPGIKNNNQKFPSCAARLKTTAPQAWQIFKRLAIYVLIGIGVGALMHGFVPANFFAKYITKENLLAVPLAVVLAVPMYANATGVLPIIEVLVAKGIPIGTALAFMMGVVGLSLPEALILRKVLQPKLLIIFFGIVTVGMILLGYGFNLVV